VVGLKLRAGDSEDLAVISAILQDALVTVGEMVYLPEESRFVLVANRFRWEPQASGARKSFERTLSGLCFDEVKGVQRRGFHPREEDRILSLLAIRLASPDEPSEKPLAVILEFAGGCSVRLEVGRLLCHLDDLGEPWPTRWQPKHPVAESD
jgi:Protein of unknown function (DUF2948)